MTNAASSDDQRIIHRDRLEPDEMREVLGLAAAAEDADGAAPLSEEMLLHLKAVDAGTVRHLLIGDPGGVPTGYAHLDLSRADASAALVVHPASRRRGLGRALITAALATAGAGDLPARHLDVWAHGDHPSAAAIGLDLGFVRNRVLWQLRRSLVGPLPEAVLPAGVTLRSFRPGQDDDAWLAVNARAFAGHPEQGRLTADDLWARMAEPWFDPSGFLLAVDGTDRLLGFHWTKVHQPAHDRGEPIGEVYVLGVDPGTHGMGLGRALTIAGLRHLAGRGLTRSMLYVDESNTAAMALYGRLGFGPWTAHVTYRRAVGRG